jgi:predicted amidohydrolase
MELRSQDLAALPALLVPDAKRFQILANCYWLCAEPHNFSRLASVFTNEPGLANLYRTLVSEFGGILNRDRGPVSALRQRLYSDTVEEALIRALSLLRALSANLVTLDQRYKAPTFDPISVTPNLWADCPELSVSPRPSSRVSPDLAPSQEEDQGLLISEFYPELHIAPCRIGACSLVRLELPRHTDEWLEDRIRKGKLKIAVSPLFAEVEFDAGPVPGFPADQPARFRVPGVKDEARQIERLKQVLNRCKMRRVPILVLPELRIAGALLDMTRDFLRAQTDEEREAGGALLIVVAGSRHIETTTGWVNRATILDTHGEVVWEHDKLVSYRIHKKNVTGELQRILGLNEHGGIECIQPGESLTYFDCSLGRFTVAICVGFFHPKVEPLLKGSGATWFLIPAMTPRIRQLEESAGTLVNSQRAATFVANCAAVGIEKARSFMRLPFVHAKPARISKKGLADGLFVYTFNKQLTLDLIFAGEKTIN